MYQKVSASSYYGLLGLHPSASVQEIRQAYRELSKLYHPDTTSLPAVIATSKFQDLNEAYATLSNPERRIIYDQKIGYSRVPVIQPLAHLNQPNAQSRNIPSSSAYLDPVDRPLSPGEIFALFILGLTFLACLVLAIAIGVTRGDTLLEPLANSPPVPQMAPAKTGVVGKAKREEAMIPGVSSTARLTVPSPKATLSKPSLDSVNSSERSHATPSS
nr:J domain-containing protein [Kovacikia minuta]